jgi:hypothetical protein
MTPRLNSPALLVTVTYPGFASRGTAGGLPIM